MILLIFGAFSIVTLMTMQNRKAAYGKCIIALAVVGAVNILSQIAFYMPNEIVMIVLDVVKWVLISIIHIWACCFIYKATSLNTNGFLNKWKKEYRTWYIVAWIMLVLGCVTIIAEYWFFAEYMAPYMQVFVQPEQSFMNTLVEMDNLGRMMDTFVNARKLLYVLMLWCIMIPAYRDIRGKKNDERIIHDRQKEL